MVEYTFNTSTQKAVTEQTLSVLGKPNLNSEFQDSQVR